MDEHRLRDWFEHDTLGQYLAEQEKNSFQTALKTAVATKNNLNFGSIAALFSPFGCAEYFSDDVSAQSQRTMWADQTFETVFAPHLSDICPQPELLLVELYRITQAQGRLLLTGFNPYSLWRFWQRKNLPPVRRGMPFHRLKRYAEQAGWQVQNAQFICRLPTEKQPENSWLVDYVEHYLWSQTAAVYAVIFRKQLCGGVHPLMEGAAVPDWVDGMAWGIPRIAD